MASGPFDDGVAFISMDNATIPLVPEPGTGFLVGVGLAVGSSLCRPSRRTAPGQVPQKVS